MAAAIVSQPPEPVLPTATHSDDLIPVMEGATPTYPNVTPQTASGSPQKATVTVQETATTNSQYYLLGAE